MNTGAYELFHGLQSLRCFSRLTADACGLHPPQLSLDPHGLSGGEFSAIVRIDTR